MDLKGRGIPYRMVNPISSAHPPRQVSEAAPPVARQPQPKAPSAQVQDTVTLKATGKQSTGDVDHEGDRK
jgi:hypothetical protein